MLEADDDALEGLVDVLGEGGPGFVEEGEALVQFACRVLVGFCLPEFALKVVAGVALGGFVVEEVDMAAGGAGDDDGRCAFC